MGKKNKTISIEEAVFNKLATEENASGLIERLLEQYYDLAVLHKHTPDVSELNEKAKELHLQLEDLEVKKKEVLGREEINLRLEKLGITNKFLIDRLRNAKVKPSIPTVRHFKEEYGIKEALQIWKAWDILHGETHEETKGEQTPTENVGDASMDQEGEDGTP